MSNPLQGKTVVTGAASGIGRAIAIGAARHGAKAGLWIGRDEVRVRIDELAFAQ